MIICKKSPNKNCILPINRDIRDITVYPKVAPKKIIRNQVPILAVAPNQPLCSLEKKKYAKVVVMPKNMMIPSIEAKSFMDACIWLNSLAWMVAGMATPAPAPMIRAMDIRESQVNLGKNLNNIKIPRIPGII